MFIGSAVAVLKKAGLIHFGKNGGSPEAQQPAPEAHGGCPDPGCQSVVTQTYHAVNDLKIDHDKVKKAMFGDDGTGGMVKSLHRTEFCIEALAKEKGIAAPD